MVVGRVGSVMSGDGERFRPGENEGQEEGLYRSSELLGRRHGVEDEEKSLGTS